MRQPSHFCVCQQALRAAAGCTMTCDRSAALLQAGSAHVVVCTLLAIVQSSPYKWNSTALVLVP